MNFIREHKKLVIILSVNANITNINTTERSINMSKKEKANEEKQRQEQLARQELKEKQEEDASSSTQSDYQSSLSIKAREEEKRREEAKKRLEKKRNLDAKEDARRKADEIASKSKPTFGTDVKVWSSDGVPNIMEDGKSIKDFRANMNLTEFGSKWGTSLTTTDKVTKNLYLVGVEQNKDDTVAGIQSQSFGWLIKNLSTIPKDSAVKFTDLNVVGSLASDHVALLCCYDWYSIWGLKDTMLVFEDISGTLKPEDFSEGKIFSAITYAHNIKVVNYKGYNIISVQYNTFK